VPFAFPEPAGVLRSWLRAFAGEGCARLVDGLPLEEQGGMVHVAASILDCVIRRILPLAGSYAEGYPPLAALPSFVDPATRQRAVADVRAMRPPTPSALGSAAFAAYFLVRLAQAKSIEEAREAWCGIFCDSGSLHMALRRHENDGVSKEAIRSALMAAVESLTA
jgi:hypothetical protein